MIDYGFIHRYPETNFHELNLDWILAQMIELRSDMRNFVNQNTIKYADPIQWNITTQYEGNMVVIDPISGNAYISTQPVPAGVSLSNTDYWSVIGNFSELYSSIKDSITNLDEGSATYADQNIPKDRLFWLNDKLYQAIIDIPTGTVFVASGEYANIKNVSVEEFLDDALQSIINIRADYNKVYDIVHDMVTDETIEAGQTVKTNGYFAINDRGHAFYKIREITVSDIISSFVDETTSKTGLIRINDTLCAELQISDVIETMAFGVKDDGSATFQNLLDYCATKNIQNVIFSSDMELSDCEIKSNINIDLNNYTITGIPYFENVNAIKNIFNCNGEYNITIKNGKVRGYYDKTGTTSITENYTIFDFINCKNVEIAYIDFQNIDQIRTTYSREAGLGTILRCVDVKFTHIHHCYFNHINGYELNGIWAINQPRTFPNCEINHNIYDEDILTSSLVTNCNMCYLHDSIYKFDYAGSAVNCFGINVKVEHEYVTGAVESVYDNCEDVYYQGDVFEANDIKYTNQVMRFAYVSATLITIKNIIMNNQEYFLRVLPGYRDSDRYDLPNKSTDRLGIIQVIIDNVRANSLGQLLFGQNETSKVIMKCTIKNSYLPEPSAEKNPITWGHSDAGVGILEFDNCDIRNSFFNAYSQANGIYAYLGYANYPSLVRVINCRILNRVKTASEILFPCASNPVKFIGIGNICDSTHTTGDIICSGANTSKLMGLNEKLS